MTTPFPGKTLPETLDDVREVESSSSSHARIGVRHARLGEFVDAYPAGTHDLELLVEGDPTPFEVSRVAMECLVADERCRRIVLAVPEQDVPAIAWAEEAGFRYVVDVEVRSGAYSLLVTEPEWVIAQPHILEDIPLKEQS